MGSTAEDSVYVFMDIPSAGINAVFFGLMIRPRHSIRSRREGGAPYDLRGGTHPGEPAADGTLRMAPPGDGSCQVLRRIDRPSDAGFTVSNGTVVVTTTTTSPTTTTTTPATTTTTAATTTTTTTTTAPPLPPRRRRPLPRRRCRAGFGIAPGQSIQAAVNNNPNGTVFIIGEACTSTRRSSPENATRPHRGSRAILGWAQSRPGTVCRRRDGFDPRTHHPELRGQPVRGCDPRSQSILWVDAQNNEIRNNSGMGVKLASGWRLIGNHIHHNQQYGSVEVRSTSSSDGNEISYNNPLMEVNPYHGAGNYEVPGAATT